ncbi:cytochrome c biogenesis protein CcdA [Helicobacter salomonis]|uniref:cytochrome c biogenesis protein CcdA n=1 Tax=Helicobacter salomonis TaxID=56878 RepID=UPI000CF121B4|nr:cytochrome c biogenesis protein CcdA [Helicobacter salomonis]
MLEDALLSVFDQTPLIASFLAGLLAFLSPCVLPLIPAYLSYISQTSLEEIKSGRADRLGVLLKAGLFVLGFGIVFWILGASMARILHNFFGNMWVRVIAGGVVVLFGLHFLGVLRWNFLYRTKALNLNMTAQKGILRHFLPVVLGMGFALGWTPCIGPIFTSIVLLSGSEQAYGLTLLGVFIAGFAIPWLIVALALNKALNLLKSVKRHMRAIEIGSGTILLLMGILIMSGQMESLGAWLS